MATWERLLSAGAGSMLLTRSLGRSIPGTLIGAALAYRGLSGHCMLYNSLGLSTAEEATPVGEVEQTRVITIDAPREELYQLFRHRPEEFARLMTPVASVAPLGDDRFRFAIEGPGKTYEFITRVTAEVEPLRFEWKTESGDIEHAGSVAFTSTSRGTEVRVDVRYRVPGGKLTDTIGRLTGMGPKETLERGLKQLKAKLETGEVPTVEGQPMGAGKERLERDGATA